MSYLASAALGVAAGLTILAIVEIVARICSLLGKLNQLADLHIERAEAERRHDRIANRIVTDLQAKRAQ